MRKLLGGRSESVGGWLSFLVFLGLLVPTTNAGAAGCPNEAERLGASGDLPDCRAYELVSPSTSDGRLLEAVGSFGAAPVNDIFPLELASPGGDSAAFMTHDSPLQEPGEPTGILDVYVAHRSGTGWLTDRQVTPAGSQSVFPIPGGLSPDHQYGFIDVENLNGTVPPLPSGSLAQGSTASYLSKPDGSFEFIARGSLGEEPYGQGRFIGEGGAHVVFSTGKHPPQSQWCSVAGCDPVKLEPDGPPQGTGGIYDRSADGLTHVVSLLPPNLPQAANQEAFYQGASKDASSIAFKIEGVLYVRINNGEGSGEETIEAAAGDPVYAGLSEDGHYLFYVVGGEKGIIHRLDTVSEEDVAVNPAAAGEVVNVSADGSHVYYISEEQIGGEGSGGQPNLFVWNGATSKYVTTAASSDLTRTSGILSGIPALTRWTSYAVAPTVESVLRGPGAESSRSTPDGRVLVFESKGKLTGYENAGHTEIYRYQEGSGLNCVSCDFSKPSAEHDARLQELVLVEAPIAIHNVSDDGSRIFFETEEALVGRDTDGVNDIYEWREGEPTPELISSGKSLEYAPPTPTLFVPRANILLSATPSGGDVLFLSQDALLPAAGAGGVSAIYDARVNGGFAGPEPSAPCLEEGCRPGTGLAPSSLVARAPQATPGSGNVKPRQHHRRRHCRRSGHNKNKHGKCRRHRGGRKALGSATATGETSSPSIQALEGRDPEASQSTSSSVASVTSSTGSGSFDAFGVDSVDAGVSTSAAGDHPDFHTRFVLNHYVQPNGLPQVVARTESVRVSLPPGLLGNASAMPHCAAGQLVTASCPFESQVGIAKVWPTVLTEPIYEPIYNVQLPHPDEEVARLGFMGYTYPVFIGVHVRSSGDFGVTATVKDAPALSPLVEVETMLWGDPSSQSHDPQRLTQAEAVTCGTGIACTAENEKREVPRSGLAFITNPSACQAGAVGFEVTSYQLPGQIFGREAPLPPTDNCQGLPFAPGLTVEPTSHVAGAATGLEARLFLPQHEGAGERATSTMREARVTLPAGLEFAAGAANWIGTCSDAQVGYHEEVDAACPDASKVGSLTITSPDLQTPLQGNIYQRAPSPGHQFRLWLIADALGLHVKIPGELQPDPQSGRLTAIFADLPQVPVSMIELKVWGGERAPLQNPDHCGTYATDYRFLPHSHDPFVSGQTQMEINQGCDRGFNPKLDAGVTVPVAGKFSPLIVDLLRLDGDQAMRGFDLELPDGELAKLRGVPLCPDSLASSGACPADTAIGHLVVEVGPGADPLWVPQPGRTEPRVYLGGPYEGSPFSVVSVVPAQAGPFDLGNIVVRAGLGLNPDTNRAVIAADPLPQFFEGVGITYRRLHVVVDRPNFSLNPTDCRELTTDSTVFSTQAAVAHPAARFQVNDCRRLKFKPRIAIALNGGTRRAAYPALTATLRMRKGDANIAGTSVALPHSEFLAQEHIGTICTRKQFSVEECPKGSVYGTAKAWTPLLAKPLEGPVYLRSSDHPLPDMVAAFGGELNVNLVGRIGSDKAGGIRVGFGSVPDAPVSRVVLKMQGGGRGLLTNSTDICSKRRHVTVKMRGQNGRSRTTRPALAVKGCGKDSAR